MQEEQNTTTDAMSQPSGTSQQMPVATQISSTPPDEKPSVSQTKKSGGKKLFTFFILLVGLSLVAVVFGVFAGRNAQLSKKTQQQEQVVTTTEEADALTTQYESVSTSDEIDDIDADLTDTTFVGIDQELTLIEQELANEE